LNRQVESIAELAEPCQLLETGDEIGSSGAPDVEELERPVRIASRESWGAFKRHVAPHLCNCVATCTLSQLASFVPIAERACGGAVVEQTKWIAEVLRLARGFKAIVRSTKTFVASTRRPLFCAPLREV